jgi:hypothetical protein
MTLAYIFSKNYLFDPNPTVTSKLYLPLLIIFGLMIVLAIIIYLQKGEVRKIVGRFIVPFLATGVLGLIYLFARYESLVYLSSRFFLFLIVILFVVWDIVLLVKTIKFIPKHLNSKKVEDKYKKYLPKAKSKRTN